MQLQALRTNKDQIVKALKKRNFDAEFHLDKVLSLDEKRRALQTDLDNTLAEGNKLSKEIGILFKGGKAEEANQIKQKTTQLKEESKRLTEELNVVANELEEALYQIPNVPHESVPAGNSEEDKEEVFRDGDIPVLKSDAKPHWDLAKKYYII